VVYVHGNHDACYEETPPEGCQCIDGKIYEYNGIRIMGLGGSMQYNFWGAPHQYTEKDMTKRAKKLKRKAKKRGVDILITHAPALGINDSKDLAHTGFQCFRDILDELSPKYFCHGHVHINYGRDFVRESKYGETTIINAYERYIIDI
jgi:Icc-related predicted phosphoesterase